MKTATLLLLIILSSFVVHAQNLKTLDDKNGFREYKFGMGHQDIPNLKLVSEDTVTHTSFYEKTDEKLTIGDATVESIGYGFYNDRLYNVLIKTKGLLNSRAVLSVMEGLYGKGEQSNQFIEKYFWLGGVVNAFYSQNSITNDAQIYFGSLPIVEERKKDAEARAKKAKGDM